MIDSEILSIINRKDENGDHLNEIIDRFRCGLDVSQLLELLDSENPELVSTGAWILSELHIELYNMPSFVSRLKELTSHVVPVVRFNALNALFPVLERGDSVTQEILDKLSRDPNEGVRRCAQAAVERLSMK